MLNKLDGSIAGMLKQYSSNLASENGNKIQDALAGNDISLKEEALLLENLFNRFDSDKSVLHNYNYLYGALFLNIKNSACDVMEVGTYKGASLRSWKSYFPTANIYGVDIDPDTLFSEPRINTMIADQNNMASLNSVNEKWPQKYDVIIDDGWHQPEASVFTMLAFVPQLKKGGIYVLEDIDQQKYRKFYITLARRFNSTAEYYSEYIDLPKFVPATKSGYDYGVLVIEKL